MPLEIHALWLAALVSFSAGSFAQTTECIDLDSAGLPSDHGAAGSSISADGRYVAFLSVSNNLVPEDLFGIPDVFLRDRELGTTKRIGRAILDAHGDYSCTTPSISADGRYVAYTMTYYSWGMVQSQIFVYDQATDSTTLPTGSPQWLVGNTNVVISGDGRFLAWRAISQAVHQIYLHDLVTGTTSVQSVNANGELANSDCIVTALSFDGRFLLFHSFADNLVPGDVNEQYDVFVRDTVAETMECVSVDPSGVQGNDSSYSDGISADGRFVAFHSVATNLVADDTNGATDVFVRDRAAGVTTRVSLGMHGEEAKDFSSFSAISSDGRFVAFMSRATNIVPGDTNDALDVFVFDRLSHHTTRASVNRSGVQGNNGSAFPVISSDGSRIVFQSLATNLVRDDTYANNHIFVRDLASGCPLAQPYCAAVANSTGSAASIASTGWASASANNLVLATSGLPASTHGLFFFGTTPIDPGVPFGNGVRCVGGPLVRLGVVTAQNGVVSQAQDLTTASYSSVQPGSTRHFEFWYRDPAAGGANFNASNALTLTFVN